MANNKDQVQILVSGSKAGERATQRVNVMFPYNEFMEQWGQPQQTVQLPDMEEVQRLIKCGEQAAARAMLAKAASALTDVAPKTPEQQVADATCVYLEKAHGFVISDEDPGAEVFYLSPGDLQITKLPVPGDGTIYMVVAAAPFGRE